MKINGGKLKVNEIKDLVKSTHRNNNKAGDFELDNEISSSTSKVYRNPNTNQVVVSHRGTKGSKDNINNGVYALGGKELYKYTPRYKEAKRVQDKANKKYGNDNITTLGYSQGGLQAEMLGNNSKEVITLNKSTRPFSNKKSKNQYDIQTQNDIISHLNPFQIKNKNEVIIPSKSNNLLKEHSSNTLDRLDPNLNIGSGLFSHSINMESQLNYLTPQASKQSLNQLRPPTEDFTGNNIPSRNRIKKRLRIISQMEPNSPPSSTSSPEHSGNGLKRKRFVKGSPEALAWGAKMRALRKK